MRSALSTLTITLFTSLVWTNFQYFVKRPWYEKDICYNYFKASARNRKFSIFCVTAHKLTDARVALEQFNWNKRWLKNSSAMLGFGILTRMRAFFGRVNISLSFVCTSAGDWVAHVSHSKYFVNTNAIESVWLYSPFPNCSRDTLLYPPFVGICHIWVARP